MRRFFGVPALLLLGALAGCSDEPMPAVDGGADSGHDASMDAGADADANRDAAAVCSSPADCDNAVYCDGVETCAPGTAGADARGCVVGAAPCAIGDACMEATTSCRGCTNLDADMDGVTECDGDCDDADATRFPGATEICDADDEDCNDTTVGARDDDVDGYIDVRCCNTATAGSMTCGLDCDDALGGVHPSVPEVCNGYDDDCDGNVDEGVLSTFYRDADEDDYGIATDTTQACMRPRFYTDTTTFDCDDADSARNPGLAEICNDRDEDCDPATNPWDIDMDGYDDLECGGSDCNDASTAFHPGLADPCDGVDVDCSTGRVGEDGDMDGHAAATDTCTPGSIPRDDCDDLRAATYPSAADICNGVDDDCDGVVDGGAACAESLTCSGVCTGVLALSLGLRHTCALTSSGSVLCWGDNANSKLGAPPTVTMRLSPGATAMGVAGALGVSAGGNHTCAHTATGVLCWGFNVSGQLGDNTTTTASAAVSVLGLGPVAQVAAGFQHTCARTDAGAVWCWGSSWQGQLGNGTTGTSSRTPVLVTLPGIVVEIAAGGAAVTSAHTCARTSIGTVYCWGSNANGQLGNNTAVTQTTPVQVVGLTDAVAISVGAGNTCAIRSGGSVVCWGDNTSGQLGDGPLATPGRRLPGAEVTGLLDATAIAVGNGHACALSTTRGLLCWGNNISGQLGVGTFVSPERVPVSPAGLSAVEIAADGTHSCARRADGAVYCWGANSDGRVGDGTMSMSRPSPTPVSGAS